MQKRKILIIVTAIILIVLSISAYFFLQPYKAKESALNILNGSDKFEVIKNNNYIFKPKQLIDTRGMMIYPGGLVEAEAYSPICKIIAESGHYCVIIRMPLNLAIFGINRAEEVIKNTPEVTEWAVSGHSLGGPMAARYIKDNPNKIKDLFLMAAYSDVNISTENIRVTLFVGSEDKVLNKSTFESNLNNLPKDYKKVIIESGNHSNFGDYGLQKGDGVGSINMEEQLSYILEEFLIH